MEEEYSITVRPPEDITPRTIGTMLNQIRPVWKGRDLIKRVERLLPVDPSSACQRLLNAAIYDLREKIINVGVDIAKEIAKSYKLPPIDREDDIIEYSTTNIIDLSYRIGILKRSEWRRVQRCYEIRRDLEHEDNEYEAVLEDCFYIFKSTIEVVLSQDPIDLLKVVDVKQIVEEPTRITVTEELLANFEHAPTLRQKEIVTFLLSTARNDKQPDIVRENAVEVLRSIKSKIQTTVIIEVAKVIEEKLGAKPIDILTAKLGHACGATAYFKKAKLKDFYQIILEEFKSAIGSWEDQTKVTMKFDSIGAFDYCPPDLIPKFLRYIVLFYIGESGGYGEYGRHRAVFYSDGAAPVITKIIKTSAVNLYDIIDQLRQHEKIKYYLLNRHILTRFENLLDFAFRSDKM